mgnify:CR=1 FL=1
MLRGILSKGGGILSRNPSDHQIQSCTRMLCSYVGILNYFIERKTYKSTMALQSVNDFNTELFGMC